jgi:hypothetical protein
VEFDELQGKLDSLRNGAACDWTGWTWLPDRETWLTPSGNDAYHLSCSHLAQFISKKFGVQITEPDWQHWNGGVFLFGDDSYNFLESWHQKTMSIFSDPIWRTRDQGTLIANVWHFGMQSSALLPKQYNFIIDRSGYQNGECLLATDRETHHEISPNPELDPLFVHIFTHFGDTNWDVWKWVAQRVEG